MKGKEKDKKPGFPDFLKYRRNSLSGKEKNSFERELQKDPFAAEAEEGFSSVDPSHLKSDMADIEKRLLSRTANDRRFIWYRMAASVAVLMLLATVFYIFQKEKPQEISSAGDIKEIIFDIQKPEVLKENPVPTVIAPNQEVTREKKYLAKEERKINAEGAGIMKSQEAVVVDSVERIADELISVAAEEEKAEAVQLAPKMAVSSRAAAKSQELKIVRGNVISSEDNLPIPGVNIVVRGTTLATTTDTGGNFALSIPEKTNPDLIANFIGMKSKEFSPAGDSVVRVTLDPDLTSLDEVVVVGYGNSKRDDAINENITYTAAEPVTGRINFNSYIGKNITRPIPGTRKEVVVLSFTVKLSGVPSDFRVIRSSGKQYSDEAIRLVAEGPKWKPASENGVNIEDEVRIRIVFK
jgi:TonB family protein